MDIFISYSREDIDHAKAIAEALNKVGLKTWWDRKIPIGKSFEEFIDFKLTAAKCVIVLWSAYSIKSRWVKDEASEGLKRDIYIPVLIEEVVAPLGFRQIQASNLANWSGDVNDEDFKSLIGAITELISSPPNVTNEVTDIKSKSDQQVVLKRLEEIRDRYKSTSTTASKRSPASKKKPKQRVTKLRKKK